MPIDVLLLEDNDIARDALRCMLEERTYSVHQATTAEQAVLIGNGLFRDLALLIAAVNLNGRSGIEVALQLRAWIASLKIVLVSATPLGTSHDQDMALYSELPSDSVRVLQKPFVSTTLFRTIDSFPSLRMTSQRIEFLKVELDICRTFCDLAETRLKIGHLLLAEQAIANGEKGHSTLLHYLSDPKHINHISEAGLRELNEGAAQLRAMLDDLERRVSEHGTGHGT